MRDVDAGDWERPQARLGAAVKKVPTRELPNWIVRAGAIFDPAMRQLLPMLGKVRNATSEKAQRLLGWKPRPREDAVVGEPYQIRNRLDAWLANLSSRVRWQA